jgi:4-alpha-glucanotransferase
MDTSRVSGILLHVSSLPSPYGVGDLGQEAYEFVSALIRARQAIWQVLPLGPTGYGDSPYQCFSAFAGNPLFVDPRELVTKGWLTEADFTDAPTFAAGAADYGQAFVWRTNMLRRAFANFAAGQHEADNTAFKQFRQENARWLDDFALYLALKNENGGVDWTKWPRELALRQPQALAESRERLAGEIDFHTFVQWCFFRQWLALKRFANSHGVRIIGDLPIFVAHDSADVWANPQSFQLDGDGKPRVVAGVPPDYFSATGQLWGNPLYDWQHASGDQYDWWCQRLAQALLLFDYVRLDHFRGFAAYWEIPYGSPTAASGQWKPGPGAALFAAATTRLGKLPILAEDLGVITPQVEALRDEFGFPGMRILQFAFGDDPLGPLYRPHHFIPHCVVYTGTHDNNTTVGWFQSAAGQGTTRSAEQVERERETTLRYVHSDGHEIHWDFIRLAMGSVARVAIFPLQDVLGLGAEARMNLPATMAGNWQWRMRPGEFTAGHEQRLRMLAETFDRALFSTTGGEGGKA